MPWKETNVLDERMKMLSAGVDIAKPKRKRRTA